MISFELLEASFRMFCSLLSRDIYSEIPTKICYFFLPAIRFNYAQKSGIESTETGDHF